MRTYTVIERRCDYYPSKAARETRENLCPRQQLVVERCRVGKSSLVDGAERWIEVRATHAEEARDKARAEGLLEY
jgi:hypothetical protein